MFMYLMEYAYPNQLIEGVYVATCVYMYVYIMMIVFPVILW